MKNQVNKVRELLKTLTAFQLHPLIPEKTRFLRCVGWLLVRLDQHLLEKVLKVRMNTDLSFQIFV